MYDQIFAKGSGSLSKNANFFANFFGENISKIITSVSGQLRRLHQIIVNGGFRQNQTSTAMMVLLLSTALFLIPGFRDQHGNKSLKGCIFTRDSKILSDDTKSVRRQKLELFNFCRPNKFCCFV
jgi:hypothetical protein